MDFSKLVVLALVAWLVLAAATGKRPPPLDKIPPVETKHEYPWIRDNQADAEFVVDSSTRGELGRWLLFDGQFFGPVGPDGRPLPDAKPADGSEVLTGREIRYHPLYEPLGFDLGVYTGYQSGDREFARGRLEQGIRYSPVRVLYGTLAPDVVVGSQGAGLGASFYLPRTFGRFWRHWGVGAWYEAPYDGSAPGLCLGLTFSTYSR